MRYKGETETLVDYEEALIKAFDIKNSKISKALSLFNLSENQTERVTDYAKRIKMTSHGKLMVNTTKENCLYP